VFPATVVPAGAHGGDVAALTTTARGAPHPQVTGGGCHPRPVLVAGVLLLSAAFGAADQYLGSLAAHPWAVQAGLLAAPWLLLPLLAGSGRRTGRGAALLGLVATLAALVGYGLMTLSPVEGAHLDAHTLAVFLRSEAVVFVGGTVTGPLFGWLGQRWRTRGALAGPVLAAAAFCLEPLAHLIVRLGAGMSATVALAEMGLAVACVLAGLLVRRQLAGAPQSLR
jgi:hypothetical protein